AAAPQPWQDPQAGRRVVEYLKAAVDVNGDVVPGGHRLLGLVPRRRDVGVRAGEDRQRRLPVRLPPLRVRPRHVADQRAVRPRGAVQQQGQVRGEWQAIDLRDEETEAVCLDEVVELGRVV